jgi:hypothetical protein
LAQGDEELRPLLGEQELAGEREGNYLLRMRVPARKLRKRAASTRCA